MANALYKSNQDIPDDMLLGNLTFISLTDMEIAERDLIDAFSDNNIPEYYVRRISQADAFRRATSSVRGMSPTICNNIGQKIHLEVDEIRSDSVGIKRIIGYKTINEQSEDISYEPIAEAVFYRQNGLCSVAAADANNSVASNICKDITDKYRKWSAYHNKDTVRNIINRIIADSHPISLMPTGLCKFVPKSHNDLMYNLKAMLMDINQYATKPNGENIMEIIPIIDTDEQRDLIEKGFNKDITEELFNFTQELKSVITKKQALPAKTVKSYTEKFKELFAKTKEYEDLLGIYVQGIYSQIKAAMNLVEDNAV